VDDRRVPKTSRCSFADHQAQHQTQIETSNMDEKPFENVLPAAQMEASHSTGLVTMCERSLQHQSRQCSTVPSSAPEICVWRGTEGDTEPVGRRFETDR